MLNRWKKISSLL